MLPPSSREHALRMVREALSNVARHACARQVWLTCELQGATVLLELRDDGRGFDPCAVEPREGHYGLLGLGERARLAGGSLRVISAPGEGTRVQFSLPCSAARAEDTISAPQALAEEGATDE
jgi:signal transduction histidine kinase